MSDTNDYPVIWVDSSSESEASGEYNTCAEDSIDLELSDNDEICHLIAALDLDERAAMDADRAKMGADRTVYEVTSPTHGTTVTGDWSNAGTAQVAGADVIALEKRQKRRHIVMHYAVFIGRPPGVYSGWRQARAATRGVSGNCLLGYATLAGARAALEYATERGWVGGQGGERPIPRIFPAPLDPNGLIVPRLTPLCPNDIDRRYYCVYRGQHPGIYASIIEAHLSAVGVPTAVHEAFGSITVAREKYLRAIQNNKIVIIPMP